MKPKPTISTVEDLKRLKPCAPALEWLTDHNITELADAWDRCPRGDWMLWICNALDLLSDRDLRLIACRCVRETPLGDGRKVWDLLTDDRSRQAVVVAERYADGDATDDQLAEAYAAAVYAADATQAAYVASAEAARSNADAYAAYAAADAAAAAAYAARVDAADAAYALDAAATAYVAASAAARVDAAYTAAATAYAAHATQADIVREIAGNPFRNSAA